MLKELGVRIAFPPGSNCHLRGQGMYHHVQRYKGTRHCLVLTNKESVRKTAPDFQAALVESMRKYSDIKAKELAPVGDREKTLLEAGDQGEDAVLDWIWKDYLDTKATKAAAKVAVAAGKVAGPGATKKENKAKGTSFVAAEDGQGTPGREGKRKRAAEDDPEDNQASQEKRRKI